MALNIYDNWRLFLCEASAFDWESPTALKLSIHTSSYSPNQNTHDYWNDVTNEVSGTNYSSGGIALANPTATLDGSGNVDLDADDPSVISQSGAGFSNGRIIVAHDDTGTTSTSTLVAYEDNGSDFGNVAGDLTITLNATGLIRSAR